MTKLSHEDKIELVRRADLALSDLTTSGGMLVTEQANKFVEMIIDESVILKECRTVMMHNPVMEINRIGFMSRILQAAVQTPDTGYEYNQGTDTWQQSIQAQHDASWTPMAEGSWEDLWYPPRRLPVALRTQPNLMRVTLRSEEVIAEIRIPYEVLEDNIERGGLETTILRLIAERAALDLEELLINGDTTLGTSNPSGGTYNAYAGNPSYDSNPTTGAITSPSVGLDMYLGLMDGVVKRLNTNVVDNAGNVIDANTFNRAIKTLPTRYRRNKAQMRFYPFMDVEQDYRMKLSSRGSILGDDILMGDKAVPVFGVPMRGVALMPQNTMLFTNPKNIIWGIQRNIRLESMRQIQDREVVIVMTARIANQIEDPLAGVKVINIGSAV